jgi:hypothetical protein
LTGSDARSGDPAMSDAAAILSETMLSLAQAARRFPAGRKGAPVSLSCVLRWILQGAKAPDGTVVRLEGVRVGGRWLTSVEALARFAERLTPRREGVGEPAPRTPTQRRRAAERAERELERLGI